MADAIFYTVFAVFAVYGAYTALRELAKFISRLCGKKDLYGCDTCVGGTGCAMKKDEPEMDDDDIDDDDDFFRT